jgi:hypothetical protein
VRALDRRALFLGAGAAAFADPGADHVRPIGLLVTATREFAKGVPDLVAADYPVGSHDPKLWASTAVAQLTPLAHALA